jgi:putative ABC transport system permease protein
LTPSATPKTASFWESAKLALDSLRGSKLRSFLTLLGVILATTTLIAVMGVIHGMDIFIAETVSDMGADGFRVVRMAFLGDWDPKKFLEYQRKNPRLTAEEFTFLKANVTLCRELGMTADRQGKTSSGNESLDGISIQGWTSNYGLLTNTQVAQGRLFTEVDDSKHLPVTVIGWDIKERFFPSVDAIGKTIDVDGRPFEVIGVAKAKGSVFGESQDHFVTIPIQSYFKVYGSRRGLEYMGLARDQTYLVRAQEEIRTLLRSYRHLGPKQEDTFMVLNSGSLVTAWAQLTGAIAATAVAVVSVFMVVGGVVIMNIMLAVVTERTREIGIRKSVGARRQDILNQFLVESSMLSGMGGLIGVTISWVIALAVRNTTSIPMQLPLYAVVLGVGLSLMTGLFFGIYPAQRAAKLDPIEALRAEA